MKMNSFCSNLFFPDLSAADAFALGPPFFHFMLDILTQTAVLIPGDNIIYSQVEKAILLTDGVLKIRNLTMDVNGTGQVTNQDELDIALDDDEYATLDIGGEYTGVSIVEG